MLFFKSGFTIVLREQFTTQSTSSSRQLKTVGGYGIKQACGRFQMHNNFSEHIFVNQGKLRHDGSRHRDSDQRLGLSVIQCSTVKIQPNIEDLIPEEGSELLTC